MSTFLSNRSVRIAVYRHLTACLLCLVLVLTDAYGQSQDQMVARERNQIEALLNGDPVKAKSLIARLLKDYPGASDSTKAYLYIKWTIALGKTNAIDSALWASREGLRVCPKGNVARGDLLKFQAILYRISGKYDLAEKCIQESLLLNDSIWKDTFMMSHLLQEYASLCQDRYQYARAAELMLKALDAVRSLPASDKRKKAQQTSVEAALAEIDIFTGNYAEGIKLYESLQTALGSSGDIDMIIRNGYRLAEAYIQTDRFDKADSLLQAIYPFCLKLKNDELRSYVILAQAKVQTGQKNYQASLPYFRTAFDLMLTNNSAFLLDCATPYLEALAKTGGLIEGRQVIAHGTVQSALATALPAMAVKFRKIAIVFSWQDYSAPELQKYYQDLLKQSEEVSAEEKRRSALEMQAQYQFERQKEEQKLLMQENELLRQKERFKRFQLLISITLGLMACLILLLTALRLRQRTRNQKLQLVAQEQEIQLHKDRSEWAEREKGFREQLIQQQKTMLSKSIADAEHLKGQLERMVQESQLEQRKEILTQTERSLQYHGGIEVLLTQFNAAHPSFVPALLQAFPKLSQADVQFLSMVRLNLTTKEISSLLHIEPRSIYVKKYRIMEKMGLADGEDLGNRLFAIS